MCYDAVSATRTLIRYAKHRGDDPAYIAALEKKLQKLIGNEIKPYYYVNGFEHPKLLCFTNENPLEPCAMFWGLIPAWIKTEEEAKKIANQTLNARVETIFEKPAFRNAAINKRCLIYIDAFYEHHHIGNKTFPYHIARKDEAILCLAGLWEEWANPVSGEIIKTVSIVTTKANSLMKEIHNNPKLDEARMPLILNKKDQEVWLMEIKSEEDKNRIMQLAQAITAEELIAHTVQKLKGKQAIGNLPEAEKEYFYEELNRLF
jgi:putative SOS response-associated peptidase YedK